MNAQAKKTSSSAVCELCAEHYGPTDHLNGACDEGKPVASPHRIEAHYNRWCEFVGLPVVSSSDRSAKR